LVIVSVDPFRLSVPRAVDSLPDDVTLLSDARVPARPFPLRVLAAVAAVALPFGLGIGFAGFFSGIFFVGTTFFGAAPLGVDVVDINDVVEEVFFKEVVGLRLAAIGSNLVLSIGGSGGRLTVLGALDIVEVTEASDVRLDLDNDDGVPEFLVEGVLVAITPVFLTLRFEATLVLRSHSAVLNEVLASLTADTGLAIEMGRLAPVLDGGRNVEGPAVVPVGGVLGKGIGFEMGLDLEVALDFLIVDAWLLTDDTLGAADLGLSVLGVVVLEIIRRVFVGDVVVVVAGMVTGFMRVGVGVRSSASGGGIGVGVGVGVFLPSMVDVVDMASEFGVSLESGLGPGGG
jgi:hypothetical protein